MQAKTAGAPQTILVIALALGSGCGAAQKKVVARPEAVAAPAPHHDADEEMQVQGVLGTLDPAEVEATFAKGGRAIEACFQAATAKRWYLGGTLSLEVRVDPAGRVKTARVAQPLGDLEAERCILGVTRGLRFPAPSGHADAEFSYELRFPTQAKLRQWGEAEVGKVFAEHEQQLESCTQGGGSSPLRVVFFVGPHGQATSVGLGSDQPIDPARAACVEKQVESWKFADPRGHYARASWGG